MHARRPFAFAPSPRRPRPLGVQRSLRASLGVALGVAVVLELMAPRVAHAEAPRPLAEGACAHAAGVADSQAALLESPDLFASLGVVSAALNGEGLGSPTPRLLIGAEYSLSRLLQGRTLRARAEVECERARALAALAPALAMGEDLGRLPALVARARVLQEALPRAEALAGEVATEVEQGRASREEQSAVSLQLDGLRQLAHQTQLDQAKLLAQHAAPGTELQAALRRYRQANGRYEALSGSLRAKAAWDVAVRGGYEKLFDVSQSVPLFGMVTVSYNLGGLFQGGANRRAVEGARAEADADFSGAARSLERLRDGLAAELEADRARLTQTRTRLADLQGQADQLKAVPTHEVDRFRRAVFFQLTFAQADEAYLSAHVHSLEAILKEGAR